MLHAWSVVDLLTRVVDYSCTILVDHVCNTRCSTPLLPAGLLALGWLHGVNTGAAGEPTDLELAESMAETCYEMYRQTPIGLAPEIVFFNMAGVDAGYPKQHTDDVGNGDFIVKPAVCRRWVVTMFLGLWMQRVPQPLLRLHHCYHCYCCSCSYAYVFTSLATHARTAASAQLLIQVKAVSLPGFSQPASA